MWQRQGEAQGPAAARRHPQGGKDQGGVAAGDGAHGTTPPHSPAGPAHAITAVQAGWGASHASVPPQSPDEDASLRAQPAAGAALKSALLSRAVRGPASARCCARCQPGTSPLGPATYLSARSSCAPSCLTL